MHIFLSYAHEQKQVADRIAIGLREAKNNVFVDRDYLKPGKEYDAQIRRAVFKSDLFVFLISAESIVKGSYALSELEFARQRWPNPSGHVLPVLIAPLGKDLPIPAYLQSIGILEPKGNIVAEAVSAAESLCRPYLRRRMWAITCIVVALIAGGTWRYYGLQQQTQSTIAERTVQGSHPPLGSQTKDAVPPAPSANTVARKMSVSGPAPTKEAAPPVPSRDAVARRLSAAGPDRSLFGGFIVTIIPSRQGEVIGRQCEGLQFFCDGPNVDVYVSLDERSEPERIIRIDRRETHFGTSGLILSDKSRVIVDFDGDAVYEPLHQTRSLAGLADAGVTNEKSCSIFLDRKIDLTRRARKDLSVIPQLVNVLRTDASDTLRIRAAEYVAGLGDVGSTQVLIDAMQNEKSPWVQARIASALGDAGDVSAIPALERVYEKYEKKPDYGYMFEHALEKLRTKPKPKGT